MYSNDCDITKEDSDNPKVKCNFHMMKDLLLFKTVQDLKHQLFEENLCFNMWANFNKHPKVFFEGGRNSVVAKRLCGFVQF